MERIESSGLTGISSVYDFISCLRTWLIGSHPAGKYPLPTMAGCAADHFPKIHQRSCSSYTQIPAPRQNPLPPPKRTPGTPCNRPFKQPSPTSSHSSPKSSPWRTLYPYASCLLASHRPWMRPGSTIGPTSVPHVLTVACSVFVFAYLLSARRSWQRCRRRCGSACPLAPCRW